MGFSEIDYSTCFLAQVLIAPNGEVINHRRKIKPSHVEKLVYGDGSGDTFMSVTDTDIGRLGQLNCSGLFRQKEAAWKSIWAVLRSVHAAWKTDEVSPFMIGLRQRLAGMGGMFDGIFSTQARTDFVYSVG